MSAETPVVAEATPVVAAPPAETTAAPAAPAKKAVKAKAPAKPKAAPKAAPKAKAAAPAPAPVTTPAAPAKVKAAPKAKAPAAKSNHPTFLEMIHAAIRSLNEVKGSSRHAIFKWIQATHGPIAEKLLSSRGNMALRNGIKSGLIKNGKSTGVFKIGDKQKEQEKNLAWGRFKDGGVRHLLRIPVFSRLHLSAGGGKDVINAFSHYHGPSWRMVVHLTDVTEAYGLYPGGQNGNPGSQYYETFINKWAAGKYYRIQILNKGEMARQKNLGVITFNKW